MRLFALSFLVFAPMVLGGCEPKSPDDSADTGGVAGAALGEEAQALVAESLSDVAMAMGMVLNFSHGAEVGFANPALGTPDLVGGVASMMFPCDAPVQYDPWCEPSGVEGALGDLSGCSRFSCLEPGVWGSEAWWADPEVSDPTAPHPLSLQVELGELQWQAAPLTPWRVQDEGGEIRIEGEPRAEVDAALSSGERLDLSFTGVASASRPEDGELSEFALSLDFSGFGAGDLALAARVELGGDGHLSGAVTRGGEPIGAVSQGEGELLVAWSQD